MKTCDKICDVLIEAGIDHVFGIPGGGVLDIWNALNRKQDKIKVVLTRHEQAAACMADMYGRLTGKPGVLIGQGPFIASSGVFGMLEALVTSSPMLVLTDTSDAYTFGQHGTSQSGTGEYGSFDLVAIMKAATKYTAYAATPEEAVQGIQLAIKHATVGRPGPAAVVMRNAATAGEINLERIPKVYPTAGYLRDSKNVPIDANIDEAIKLLVSAKSPMIISGNGVNMSRAHAELKEIAEMLGAPVATSENGKSTFAEIHPLSLGVMGRYGQRAANHGIAQADVLLVAGCRLNPYNTYFENPKLIDPARQKIIQIDIDPRNAGWTFPIDVSLVGDLKYTLRRLIISLLATDIAKRKTAMEDTIKKLVKLKESYSFFESNEMYSSECPTFPQRLIKELNDVTTPDTLITMDAGSNKVWMSNLFRSKAVRTVFVPGGMVPMGWGIPAALAAKLVHPDKPVISVSGDGGFGMMLHELSTAITHHLNVVFVVFNDSGLAMVRDLPAFLQNPGNTDFAPTNYANIASAFGCKGIRIEDPSMLSSALKEALQSTEPVVVDVVINRKESFLKIPKM